MKRLSQWAAIAIAALVLSASPAPAAYTIWTGFTPTSGTGTLADPSGTITVNYSITGGGVNDFVADVLNSSDFGLFFGGINANDVYEPNPPGTDEFLNISAGSDTALYTLTFSSPVINPVFHVFNQDFRNYSFLGGITPTVVSGLNLVAAGSMVGDNDGGLTADFAADSNKGNPAGSAYGSFMLAGTFTTIQWTRPLTPGAVVTDGNALAVSATAVPEPSSVVLMGAGVVGVLGYGWRRRKAAKVA
jgi:hypothetical protein